MVTTRAERLAPAPIVLPVVSERVGDPAVEASLIDPATYPRKVLFVAGAGRSGTSTMAGLMRILGLHVPQPEVDADETNPKGFGEPRWVVDHHDRLLKEALVQVSDSRPEAWFETGRVATREPEQGSRNYAGARSRLPCDLLPSGVTDPKPRAPTR